PVVGGGRAIGTAPASISGKAGHCDLGANVAKALFHEAPSGLLDLLEIPAAGMAVRIDGIPAFAAKQLVNRHPGPFAENVPQSHVDAAQGIAEHRPVAPVGADEG